MDLRLSDREIGYRYPISIILTLYENTRAYTLYV